MNSPSATKSNLPFAIKTTGNNTMTVVIGGESFDYELRDSVIANMDGSKAHEMKDIFVPVAWSQTAVDIMSQKYFRRAGVPMVSEPVKEKGVFARYQRREPAAADTPLSGETSAHEVFHRLAGCWTYWGCKRGYFKAVADADAFYGAVYRDLYYQLAAPNSPQWFNTGLHWAYGISTKLKGTPAFYYDPDMGKVVRSDTSYVRPQPHACFIQSVEDTLVGEYGIMDLYLREATVFKYGSGSGTNYSNLRGEGEKLSSGGRSSGLMSFLKPGDASAGSIKSGGTTRRAARLVCLNADHPEIEAYVDWKVNEENKVAALVTGSKLNQRAVDAIVSATTPEAHEAALEFAVDMGVPDGLIERANLAYQHGYTVPIDVYDSDWQSEAYATVNGQNANNSVSINDSFLKALAEDGDWNLTARTDGSVMKTIKASYLWDKIAYAAWASADPAIIYFDIVNAMNTCIGDEYIVAANPCVEYHWFNDTACNLASWNVKQAWLFAAEDPVQFAALVDNISETWTKVLDISIEMAQFPSEKIAYKTWQYRTLGLGYANLGGWLMHMGHPYGSDASVRLTEAVTAMMGGMAYLTSAQLAGQLGAFPRFEPNRETMLQVIAKHEEHAKTNAAVCTQLNGSHTAGLEIFLSEHAAVTWNLAYEAGVDNGYRNAQVTVIAPTGTIAMVMDCDTTGIEPDFSTVKHKKLAGGGYLKIVNRGVPAALEKLGYDATTRDAIVAYICGHNDLPDYEDLEAAGLERTAFLTYEDLLGLGVAAGTIDYVVANAANYWDIPGVLKAIMEGSEEKLPQLSEEILHNTKLWWFGHGTVEGCSLLKPEHLAVFDCSVPGGSGVRSISAHHHMVVMAGAQKYISGGISKTINLPGDATVDDIKRVYTDAHAMGIKAVSVYRDGSKLSQPLMTAVAKKIKAALVSEVPTAQTTTTELVKEVERVVHKLQRRRLPNKRRGSIQKADVGGHKMYIHTGEYADGTLGEIFIDINKEGATLRALLNNFAIAVSIGLQYGVPLSEFIEAFVHTKFEPAGLVRSHDHIKTTESLLDFVFRHLAIEYANRDDLANIPPVREEPEVEVFEQGPYTAVRVNGPDGPNVAVVATKGYHTTPVDDATKAVSEGYTGNQCSSCGSFRMKRTGVCNTCEQCGTTTGCG